MLSSGCVALILAAGFSKRFGTSDKRTAQLVSGEPMLASVVTKANNHFEQSFVVIRPEDDPQLLGLDNSQRVVRAQNAHLGIGASISSGFKYLVESQQDYDACAVFLADMPVIADKTVIDLKHASNKEVIVRPVFQGKPGHPVVFGRSYWQELSELQPHESGKYVVEQHADSSIYLDTTDAGVHRDIDTPADLHNI